MNTRKSILLLGLIALGVIVGGSLSLVTNGGGLVGGAAGGLLGGILYCLIQMAVSRRKRNIQSYDHLEDQHPIHYEISQTPEARVRGMQDNLMADIMNFHPPRH